MKEEGIQEAKREIEVKAGREREQIEHEQKGDIR